MYCKSCGKEISNTAAFCPHCGQQSERHASQKTTDKGSGKTKSQTSTWFLILGAALAGVVTVAIAVAVWVFFFKSEIGPMVENEAATADASMIAGNSDVDEWRYPEARVLDITAVPWTNLAPFELAEEPESLLLHRAWMTEDLAQKVGDYYQATLFNANWEATRRYSSSSGPWQLEHYQKGDDVLAVAIHGNLSSAAISQLPDIGLEPGQTLILVVGGNPMQAYLEHGHQALENGDWERAWQFAKGVMLTLEKAGDVVNNPIYRDAEQLLKESELQMPPEWAAEVWLNNIVSRVISDWPQGGETVATAIAETSGEDNNFVEAEYIVLDDLGTNNFNLEPDRARLGDLDLVREDENGAVDIYGPAGSWIELSNDGNIAVVQFIGIANLEETTRIGGKQIVGLQSYDYELRVTLSKDETGLWQVDQYEVMVPE
ncbi:MAG: zinc ribbon domain-containing protein [Anaerolineaceae bacterium]|nr:zinc ribbon domain-containing protein [Anaerolineaceae bacterium]